MPSTRSTRFFVFTGGPGAGKTTLIEELARTGFATAEEAGRGVIRDQVAIGGPALPWRDRALYAELMLAWDMRNHGGALSRPGPVLFDRGVVDNIGYLRLCGLPAPDHMFNAAKLFRYNRRVFILPPWPEIFRQDGERKQDFEEAERTFRTVAGAYRDHGYELIEVPRLPLPERAGFVRATVGA